MGVYNGDKGFWISICNLLRIYNVSLQWESAVGAYNGSVQWVSAMLLYNGTVQWESPWGLENGLCIWISTHLS